MEARPSIGVSEFVKRQTPESKYAHFDGSWDELLEQVYSRWCERRSGYRDGVVLVSLLPDGFFTSITPITPDMKFVQVFKPRKEGEAPYLQHEVYGNKVPARYVEAVLYRADVLEEGKERSTDTEWEIISINASPNDKPVPMNPVTMARNQLGQVGGTKGHYTSEEWAEAVDFWSTHTMVTPVKGQNNEESPAGLRGGSSLT